MKDWNYRGNRQRKCEGKGETERFGASLGQETRWWRTVARDPSRKFDAILGEKRKKRTPDPYNNRNKASTRIEQIRGKWLNCAHARDVMFDSAVVQFPDQICGSCRDNFPRYKR